jgi:hypothetical protein
MSYNKIYMRKFSPKLVRVFKSPTYIQWFRPLFIMPLVALLAFAVVLVPVSAAYHHWTAAHHTVPTAAKRPVNVVLSGNIADGTEEPPVALPNPASPQSQASEPASPALNSSTQSMSPPKAPHAPKQSACASLVPVLVGEYQSLVDGAQKQLTSSLTSPMLTYVQQTFAINDYNAAVTNAYQAADSKASQAGCRLPFSKTDNLHGSR